MAIGGRVGALAPPPRAAETFIRLRERFAPARMHVAASAMEAGHMAVVASAATWHGPGPGEEAQGTDTPAASGTQLYLGRWPLILEAYRLLVRLSA